MRFANRITHPTLRERGEIVIEASLGPLSLPMATAMLAEARYVRQHLRGGNQRKRRSVRALRHRLIDAEAVCRGVMRWFSAQDRITGRCIDAPIPARP